MISGEPKDEILHSVLNVNADPLIVPEHGHSLTETIAHLARILQAEFKINERVVGHMLPHDCVPSFVGGLAGKFLNGNTIIAELSPVVTVLERQVVGWLAREFGFSTDTSWLYSPAPDAAVYHALMERVEKQVASGNMTVGGTTANLSALLVARNRAYEKEKVAQRGLFEQRRGVVLGSEYAHYSLKKICNYAGLGSDSFIPVKCRDKRIDAADPDPRALRASMWRTANEGCVVIAVVATVGTTENGSIDDVKGVGMLLDEFEQQFRYRPYFHVDAAHGGGFVFHDRFNPAKGGLFSGIERADSITVDPHKMLFTHYNAGCILFKDRREHWRLKQEAGYLWQGAGEVNFGQFRVEGSMGLEATLQTWTTLHALGRRGLQAVQQHTLDLTQHLKRCLLEQPHIELLNPDAPLNLLCFRFNDSAYNELQNDEITKGAQQLMVEAGRAYVSSDVQLHTVRGGEQRKVQAFRAVVMHPWTTAEDIDATVAEVMRCVGEMKNRVKPAAP